MTRTCNEHCPICSAVAAARTHRDHHGPIDALREPDAPLEDPHATHGTADHRSPPTDTEMVRQQGFDLYLVADGDDGEPRSVAFSVPRDRCRARRPLASTQDIRTHHEIPVRI